MKKIYTVLLFSSLLFMATKQVDPTEDNPFFKEYATPFEVPPFDKIDTTHYIPAFERGFAEQQAEIDAIVTNAEAPTFENTIMAMEKSGKLLRKVNLVFGAVSGANTTKALQNINRKISPLSTKHRDNINLNEKLFARIKTVYDNRLTSNLDAEQLRTVEKYYDDFIRSGANLNETDKQKLREMNQKMSALGVRFGDYQLEETNTNFVMVVDNIKDLDGLSKDDIDAAAITAKQMKMEGKWVFTLQKPSLLPFLQYAKNRELREKLYKGYYMRGNNNNKFDTKEIVAQIYNLRLERAKLMGYKTFAEFGISNNMAQTPENVYKFLNDIMAPTMQMAIKDRAEMQKIIDKEGGKFKLESWDWWYYAEKLRQQKFNLAESDLKPYFKLSNVRDGMFAVASKMYGITFKQRTDIPVYHPEVEVFEVSEADGSHTGLLFLDYHPRAGKRSGAWCGRLRGAGFEDGKRVAPLVTIVCNFTRPTGATPALLTWDETETLFHEFGHALHGLFTTGKYSRIAGNLQRDMVELPSQIMENWAAEPEVLKMYAKHYETGKVIPNELIKKMQASSVFNQGFTTGEYVAASLLDMDWHSLTEPFTGDVLDFEKKSMEKAKLIPEILPRYRTTYFGHSMGGYAAGYYVYLWAAVLDSDAFQSFVDSKDLFNKEIAAKFRKNILSEGGNDEGMIQYKKFRGQEPSNIPLLKKRGLYQGK